MSSSSLPRTGRRFGHRVQPRVHLRLEWGASRFRGRPFVRRTFDDGDRSPPKARRREASLTARNDGEVVTTETDVVSLRPVVERRRRPHYVAEISTTTKITTTSHPISIKKTTCFVRRPGRPSPRPAGMSPFGEGFAAGARGARSASLRGRRGELTAPFWQPPGDLGLAELEQCHEQGPGGA